MIKKISIFLLVILWPVLLNAQNSVLWEGALWNLFYEGDVSTYGHFRISREPDSFNDIGTVLKVEWVERYEGKDNQKVDRVYASILLPELNNFIGKGELEIKMGRVPSAISLTNDKGEKIWLMLWEPARYEIQTECLNCDMVPCCLLPPSNLSKNLQ